MQELLNTLKEREKRSLTRRIERGEIEFDLRRDCFVFAEDGKELKLGSDGEDSENGSGEERKSDDSDQEEF